MRIHELILTGPFAVFDNRSQRTIFRNACNEEPGDLPPDVAMLPVLGIYAVDDVIYIDTEVK